jgi:hypothetical protein
MAAFDGVDRALDRMDRFDDWVRDRLPATWVKTVPALPPRADERSRRSDLASAGLLMLRFLVPALFLAGWLALRGTWWAALLGTVVVFVAVSVAVVFMREVRRRA